MAKKKLEIVYVKPDKLKPWPDNPKLHNTAAIVNSVERFDITQPILVQKSSNRIIAGHGRMKAFEKLGIKEIPVIYLDMDDKAAKAYLLVDNQLTIDGGFDEELLMKVIGEIKIESPEIHLEELGFEDMFEDMKGNEAKEDEFDVPAEPKNERGIKLGDVFTLGKHRLMCGDATKEDDVKKLMDGKKADLCLTDPPYGVGFDYNEYDDTVDNLKHIIEGALPLIFKNCERTLLTPGNHNQRLYPEPDWTLCWFVAAGTGMNKWGFTCWQPILAYGTDPYLAKGLGSRPDAFTIVAGASSKEHTCAKPMAVWAWILERGSIEKGQLIYDPFGGSGTTLIAAEQLGRICYMMELDPSYVNVILDRWEALTHKKACKVGA